MVVAAVHLFPRNPTQSSLTMLFSAIAALALGIGATAQVTYQNSSGTRLRVDNGTYGPEIEEVHYCRYSQKAETWRRSLIGVGRL